MFRNLLKELNDRSANSENPPVTCIVGDGVMPFTITAAQELGIPVAVFWTFPACGYMGFYQYRAFSTKAIHHLQFMPRILLISANFLSDRYYKNFSFAV
ncbi:hypothetical protein RHMOL_Rhmol12G0006200 [Rhododendron molle]|uniref:Uncharacterized protein n=1 Tax=Rhododendron molle TaxID=49168 RepID=A0ACC0LDX4_RHOML|nr:hypothetical protein RHMOL_Rhmol12G0006200 [Rhododendron molle]